MTVIVTEAVIDKNIIQERESKKDTLGRSYATGKRKNSIARVWIKKGKGKITINSQLEYLQVDEDIFFVKEK